MHYVSWDRSDKENLKLLAEAGPEVLGVFQHDRASVNGEIWDLTASPESGAVATRGGQEIVRALDPLRRGDRVRVDIEGRGYTMVGETSKNWIIDDAYGNKVGQFTRENSGVRKAILEFEGETDLPPTDIAGLAWLSRELLEARQIASATPIIALLALCSAVVLLVYLL
ncbi:hypothetical protein JKI95_09845 [Corynebacterium aquatimens]|uniref:hypothetical protein n=1 Tax=Corynebacterium TaxID=1716 RepID=UPI001F3E6A5F|nr:MULTISPECIES: hypothetical protein [Corynebacterium]QYH19396.1 hypothetical protein JKI95_09845 [Corynebacterium aquatimens]UIZ91689.1 hypothetical protein JZY91_08090 [Corynebacterium sp. CNCTC7651]